VNLLLGAVLWLSLICTVQTASAATGAFAPGFDANGLNATGLFGNSYILESIVGRGRFHVSPKNPDTTDAAQGKSSDSREMVADEDGDIYSDFTWMVGYNYYRSGATPPSSTAEVFDDAHTFRLGIAWDISDAFDFIASGSYQVIPEENYSQGFFEFDLGYYISLVDKSPTEKVEGEDAEAYFLRKAKEQQKVVYPPKDVFPNLEVGLDFNFSQYRKSQTTSGRQPGDSLSGDQLLNQAGSGPKIALNLSHFLSIGAKFLIYYYDNPVQPFLANTSIGQYRPRAGLALADLDDTTQILNTFPSRALMGYGTIRLGTKTTVQGELQYSTYSNSIGVGAASATSMGGILTQEISNRLRIGGELDLTTLSSGLGSELAAGFTVGYQF
jgi:hypothetical protein